MSDAITVIADAGLLCLAMVFGMSGLSKIRRPTASAAAVVSYEILPRTIALALGYLLGPAECLLALAFLTRSYTQISLIVCTLMSISFLLAMGINLRRGRAVPCGCFGNPSEMISRRTFARLILILSLIAGTALLATLASASGRDLGYRAPALDIVWTGFLATALLLGGVWLLNVRLLLSEMVGSRG